MAGDDAKRRDTSTRRRHALALLKREAHLARRIAEARAAGDRLDFTAAECSAIGWAVREIERVYPAEVAHARRDLRRLEERRRALVGGIPA